MNLRVQWSEIRNGINDINAQLKQLKYHPDIILGVANGGIVPAVMLRNVLTGGVRPEIELLRYDKVYKKVTSTCAFIDALKYFVIDDIFDTGETYEAIESYLSKSKVQRGYAFLYGRRNNLPQDNDFLIGNIISHSHWLDFPWEKL